MADKTTDDAAPTPADIATHPVLGQRVSALRYAREALTAQTGAAMFSTAGSKLDQPVDALLKVGDWLLGEHSQQSDTTAADASNAAEAAPHPGGEPRCR